MHYLWECKIWAQFGIFFLIKYIFKNMPQKPYSEKYKVKSISYVHAKLYVFTDNNLKMKTVPMSELINESTNWCSHTVIPFNNIRYELMTHTTAWMNFKILFWEVPDWSCWVTYSSSLLKKKVLGSKLIPSYSHWAGNEKFTINEYKGIYFERWTFCIKNMILIIQNGR